MCRRAPHHDMSENRSKFELRLLTRTKVQVQIQKCILASALQIFMCKKSTIKRLAPMERRRKSLATVLLAATIVLAVATMVLVARMLVVKIRSVSTGPSTLNSVSNSIICPTAICVRRQYVLI